MWKYMRIPSTAGTQGDKRSNFETGSGPHTHHTQNTFRAHVVRASCKLLNPIGVFFMKRLLLSKPAIIGLLSLALLIPLSMI